MWSFCCWSCSFVKIIVHHYMKGHHKKKKLQGQNCRHLKLFIWHCWSWKLLKSMYVKSKQNSFYVFEQRSYWLSQKYYSKLDSIVHIYFKITFFSKWYGLYQTNYMKRYLICKVSSIIKSASLKSCIKYLDNIVE